MPANKHQLAKIPLTIIITSILLLSTLVSSCSPGGFSGPPKSMTLANLHLTASALVYIAEEKNYFNENGLAVTIKEFDTGIATTNAILSGEANLATVAEFVTVGNIIQKQPIKVLGTMDKTLTTNLIGMKNRGVLKVADLAGKRIGLGKGTSSEFYLGRFLELNGMNIKSVTMVDLPPTKLQDAVAAGDVDAIVGWAPYTTQIIDRFTNQTIVWQVQSSQPVFGNIIGTAEWTAGNQETIILFWKSLAQAESFLLRSPDDAKSIVQKKLGLERTFIDSVWPQYTFELSMEQALVTAMEDEARWLITNNFTKESQMPKFIDYFDEKALKIVKPEVVNIIR